MGELCGQTTDERYLRESVFDVDVMIVRDFMAVSRLCGCGERERAGIWEFRRLFKRKSPALQHAIGST